MRLLRTERRTVIVALVILLAIGFVVGSAGIGVASAQAADYTFNEIAYWSNGTRLGVAQNNAHWWGYSIVQDFNGGSWGWFLRANTGSNTAIWFVRGGMRAGWVALNGAAGWLKGPLGDEYGYMDGARQNFVGGTLIWRPGWSQAVPAATVGGANAIGTAWGQRGKTSWNGSCEAFVKWCYGGGTYVYPSLGSSVTFLTAKAHYTSCKNRGLIKTAGTPPPGSLVFYDVTSYGHVALSLGNNRIISTSTSTGVGEVNLNYFGSYLGYSLQP